MKIKQHIPSFCDGIEPQTVKFNDLNELTEVPFVKNWLEDKNLERLFLQLTNDLNSEYYLMAKHKDKTTWVVGFIDKLDLPECVKGEQIYL